MKEKVRQPQDIFLKKDHLEHIMGPHGQGRRIAREDTLEYAEQQNEENTKRAMRQPEQRTNDDNYQGTQVTEERDERGNIISHLSGFIKEYDDIGNSSDTSGH